MSATLSTAAVLSPLCVAVTGGGGFVGSALVERLLQQHPSATVVLLDTFKQISASDDSPLASLAGAPASLQQRAEEWAAERFGAGWEQRRCVVAVCDICDSASVRRVLALHGPRVVCHLAAEAGVRSCEREPALCQRVNVAGTRIVLQEARACGVQHFLFASSSSVYGRQPAPWHEAMTPDPQGEYAVSKMQGESLCAAESHHMRVTVLRMFSVYGPRGRTGMLVGACLQAAEQRRLLEINGDGEQQRDNTYIDDAVAGWMAAMEASLRAGAAAPDNPTGNFKIFNLGTGRPCSVNGMVALLEQRLGRRVQRATGPADPADVPLTQADTNLAQRELGFSAHISVKEGAHRCVEHMLASQRNQTVALVTTTGTGERWELFLQRCLPAMQRQRWLAGAISSVHPLSLLVVVVDNEESGRVDALRADVSRVQESTPFPIVLLRNWRNKGASGAWNTGLLHLLRMSGERDLPPSHALYVAICDDDDAWEPSHVSVCAAEAVRTGADLIVAGLIRCDTSGVTLQSIPSPSEMTAEVLLERNAHVQGSNLFARLDAFAAAGLFDEHLPSCTDRDLLLRMIDIPGFMQRSIAQHTVRHYADDSRLRLSSKGSPAKLLGLTRFWLKHRHRMSEAVAGKCAQRAKQLFGWTPPPEVAATSTLPPSNDVEVAVAVAPASQPDSALPAAGAPSQRPLVVGIVSDSGSARVAPLLQSLHGLGACDFIASVDVLVLENGPHCGSGALSTAVEQARAGGLRCSLIPIEQQADDVSAGALPGWVNPSLSRRQSIAESRTCLQYYIARFVRCLEQHTSTKPVAWILDDDKAWEAGEFHSQLTRVWSAAAASDDIAAVFGMATGSPPLPAALVCRTQLVDLVAHLQRLSNTACAEDLIRAQCAVDLADVCRQQPDFYHDLAAGRFGGMHLERPFLDAKQGHSAEAELARLAARLEAVCAGAMPFRLLPVTVAESELEHFRPSIHRGGCTLVFQPSALEQVPNTAPVLCGMHTRRSDFVWALLCARMRDRRLLQCRSLLVQHQRATSLDSPPPDAPMLANAVLTDVMGHAVYRALDLLLAHDHRASKLDFSPEHVQLFLGAFGAALSERATLLRASLMRVRALIALAMQLLECTHAWWNRPDEPSTLHRLGSARRMTASLQRLRDAYVTERARQSWDDCLAQLVMDGAKEASLRAWLLGLHGELQERQAVMGSEELRAAFEQRLFLPHRQKCAVAALASLGPDLSVKLLGVGYEGVSYLSPIGIVEAGDASSSSSVAPAPPVVLKVLDLFQLRTSLAQRDFLRALMHNDKAKRLLGLRAVHFNKLHRLLIVEKEYVSGEPLSASTKERCESPVCLLHALRAASISCRDLQSKNLIVSDSGTLHLIDVGMDLVQWSEREEQSAMRKLFFSWHWAHRTDVRELMRESRTQLLPEMEAYERFNLALAGPYDAQEELFHWLLQQTHTLCRRRVDSRSPVTILDYGCGDGRLLQLMYASFARENPFVKLVGYDPHEPHLPTDSLSALELSFTRKAEDLMAVRQRCDVVVCSRVVCCIEDEAMRALVLDLASAVRGSGTVLLALCNPFFTQSGDTPAQRRVLPVDFDPLRVCRWTKVVTGTGHERTELHRPMHVLKRELMAAGLEICAVAQTRTADIRDFLPNSDTIMLTVKPFWREEQMRMAPLLLHCQAESDAATRVAFAAGSPPCTLLIKTCVREEAQLYERVTHLVRQLEGPRVFHERLLVVDNKRSHFVREYRSQQLQESDGAETQEERFHAVCKKLLAEQWVDRVLFASSNAVDIRTRNARWFGESNSPHSHTTGGLHVTSTLQAIEEARCSFILQVDSDLLIGRRAPLHDYLAEAAAILQRDPHAVTLSLNILRSGPLEPSFLNEHGRAHRVEVRGCFFVRERLQQLLPIPRDDSMWERHADGTTQLRTSWYRAMDSALQRNWARSYRGGAAHRTFFVHPPNPLKRELRDLGLLADFVERGWIPSEQIGQVDLHGQLWGEWIGCAPKAVAPFVFVVLGRNVPPSKVLRCLQSVEAADAGIRAHSVPSDVCAWSMVVVDDASTPHHAEQIRLECARLGERVTLVQPRYHRNGGANTVLAIRHLVSNPDSVVITLDLDDALIGDRLFKCMHQAYHIEGADCTVGNHLRTDKPISPPNPYPAMLTHPRRTRGGGNVWKHLRSFRQHLFARIRDEDLRTDRGLREYFTHGADWVLMLPIVEASFRPLELHEKLYLWDPHRHSDANFFQHERRALIEEAVTEIVRKPEYSKLRPIVAVVGDAAYGPEDTRKRLLAEELGQELANAGYCLLTGGLGGCMEFACAGARSTRQPHACTVGLLPGGSPRDSNPFVDVALPTTLSHARNALVAQADALVAVAGGAGTVSELSLAWANGRMCILLAPHLFPHSATTAFAGRTIDQRVRFKGAAASGEFRDCVFAANSPQEVVQLLHAHLHRYQRRGRAVIKSKL